MAPVKASVASVRGKPDELCIRCRQQNLKCSPIKDESTCGPCRKAGEKCIRFPNRKEGNPKKAKLKSELFPFDQDCSNLPSSRQVSLPQDDKEAMTNPSIPHQNLGANVKRPILPGIRRYGSGGEFVHSYQNHTEAGKGHIPSSFFSGRKGFVIDRSPFIPVATSSEHSVVYYDGSLAEPSDTINESRHVDDPEQQETASYWFAAEHAHQHAVSCKDQIAAAFKQHGVHKLQYAVYAGFDEFLIRKGGSYLEQIHVLSSAALDGMSESSLISNLGKIFSPFSAVLFTPSSTYEIPVYKSDGTTWQFDELVYYKASRLDTESRVPQGPITEPVAGPSNHPSLVSVCHCAPSGTSSSGVSSTGSDSSPGNSSDDSNRKGKDKAVDDIRKGGKHNEDDTGDNDPGSDPESDPDPGRESIIDGEGRVVINLVSEIYSSHQRMKDCMDGDFQKLSMRCAFDIQAHSEPSKTPEVKVKFNDLRFGSEKKAGPTGYNQYHLRVKVKSDVQTADITDISPRQTSAFERAVKDSSTTKTARSGGFSLAGGNKGVEFQGTIGVNGTVTKERSHGLEKTKLLDQIAETSSDGSTRLDFTIDDPSAQEYGVHLSDDRLPAVTFRFPAAPLPDHVTVSIVSFWSLISPEGQPQSWLSKLFYGNSIQLKDMPVYSNLCQALTVVVSSKIKGEHQHKTKVYVNSGNAALDYHAKTECISPLTSDLDVRADITNDRCLSGSF